MDQRLEAIVHGNVQGVNFRYYTKREADSLGLTGWVANRYDGSVEVVAEGDEQTLQRFVEFLQRGSPHARVKNITLKHFPATNEFRNFTIRFL